MSAYINFPTPSEVYHQTLVPSFQNYIKAIEQNVTGKNVLRGPAMQAASGLFHFRDNLETIYGKGNFGRRHVVALCPAFDLIADVCNAEKHFKLDRKDRLFNDISDVNEFIVHHIFRDSICTYSYSQAMVLISLLTGETKDLFEVAVEVMNFWSDFLVEKDFISDPIKYIYPFNEHYTRDETEKVPKAYIEVDKNKEEVVGMLFREYNYQTESF